MSNKLTSLPFAVLCAVMLIACGKSETPSVPPVTPTSQPADEAAMQTVAPPLADAQVPVAKTDVQAAAKPSGDAAKSADDGKKKPAETANASAKVTPPPVTPQPAKVADESMAKVEAAAAPALSQAEKSGDSGAQAAIAMPDLAKKNGCVACHAIDKKMIGPAWRDVANKYKGATEYAYAAKGSTAPDAQKLPLVEGLVMKVSKGGSGNWGTAAMIANDPGGKKQDQIKELVEFILGLAK